MDGCGYAPVLEICMFDGCSVYDFLYFNNLRNV